MKSKHLLFGSVFVALALMIALSALMSGTAAVQAEPLAAPTPISVDRAPSTALVALVYDGSITADTRLGCVQSANYNKADVMYTIDQGTVNTTTLKLQFTNDTPGATGAAYVDGLSIVASNAADATDLQQFQLFGAWTCVYADVTNTNPLGVKVTVLLK